MSGQMPVPIRVLLSVVALCSAFLVYASISAAALGELEAAAWLAVCAGMSAAFIAGALIFHCVRGLLLP